MLKNLIKDLNEVADPKKAEILSGFFKTGKGEYGEGDIFLGIVVPEQRKITKKYSSLDLKDIQKLLDSKYHEYRLTALLVLIEKYKKADKFFKRKIVSLYLKNVKKGRVNNWDLVDLSAPQILGDFFLDKEKSVLYNLARSKSLWARRVAILSTLAFIRKEKFFNTLKISKILISDKENLIHKAVGWMLREVGKKNLETEEKFLNKNVRQMPRTMLRYAIERFSKKESANWRKKYLKNKK